jgi:hypothetical protein
MKKKKEECIDHNDIIKRWQKKLLFLMEYTDPIKEGKQYNLYAKAEKDFRLYLKSEGMDSMK